MAGGKFITLEGGEGGGKTTQAALLTQQLRRNGIDVLQTREPGGTPRAEAIREALLSGKAKPFGPLGEAVLLYAARQSHLELAIRPALLRGAWVICDRFSDSTRAYQGAAGGLSASLIDTFEASVVGPTVPDLTFVFDIAPEEGLRRAALRNQGGGSDAGTGLDRFEAMNIAFHKTLREAFLEIAKTEPGRCVVVDASAPVQKIADEVWGTVRSKLQV